MILNHMWLCVKHANEECHKKLSARSALFQTVIMWQNEREYMCLPSQHDVMHSMDLLLDSIITDLSNLIPLSEVRSTFKKKDTTHILPELATLRAITIHFVKR